MAEDKQNAIVANGGWVETTRRWRPKTMLYTMLSAVWVFPSLGAVCILIWNRSGWLQATPVAEAPARLRFEEWIAIGLLLLHAVFVTQAVRHTSREPVQERRALTPNPDVDPRKLY